MTATGTFILADISGYTPFVTGVGIEHGKEITAHLLNGILKSCRGHWKVGNIEGDCVFFYRQGREEPAELLLHAREIYKAFSREIFDISARAACPCGACTKVNQLALKFIVHAGEFDSQTVGRRKEVFGPDVVLAHRLLKNSVPIDEYVLLTHQYAGGVAAPGPAPVTGKDEYEGIGPVEYTYLDLAPVRQEVEASNRFFVTPEQAKMRIIIDIDAGPDEVWDALCSPEKHLEWSGEKEHWEAPSRHGRIGKVHRCVGTDGSVTVWVLTAIDDASRRRTSKLFVTLAKDVYATQEVIELADDGSRLATYITFKEAIPVVSHLARPVMQLLAERGLRKALLGLKAYCERAPG
ncbi:MAG: DUF2652 domain-containing protein [Chloroflexi bacterium]|nr:DUF2652 domain-containing protein [Chloroflexota bacterium]